MRLALTVPLLLLPTAAATAAVVTIPLFADVESYPSAGFFPTGQQGHVYLYVGAGDMFPTVTAGNSILIGSYTISDSLVVTPTAFSLGALAAKFTDTTDDYVRVILQTTNGSNLIASVLQQESQLFGLPSGPGFQGVSVVGAEFRLDEIRSRLVPMPPGPDALSVYYLNASVALTTVPEPSAFGLLAGLVASTTALRRRKRRAS